MNLEKNEVVNNLLNKNLKIIQRTDFFNFSLDSLLVANFLSVGRGEQIFLIFLWTLFLLQIFYQLGEV